jgi:hypothetical protein
MNRDELKVKLDELNIPVSNYSLYGIRNPDAIILECGFKWRIYGIDERGGEHEKAAFATESEACVYFYKMMVRFKVAEEKRKNMHPIEKPLEENRKFIVSNTDDTIVQKDDENPK